ncbi:ThiF family adenylyltransferase [Desulfobacterales bacterium HSG16]|nr:ThiF family adenylyltransferase [Desulfobacterales bacterium HSG16]
MINNEDRYDRQKRIRGWNQEKLKNARILIAGAGSMGNEIIKNMALAGIGHILILDMDIIESANLSSTILFRANDAGLPRALVAAEAARKINPDIDVKYMYKDISFDSDANFLRQTDIVVGGLDSIESRCRARMLCSLASVPYIDAEMSAWAGEVRWFMPGDSCSECELDGQNVQDEFHNDDSDENLDHPVTISTSSVVAGILTREVLRYIFGNPVNSRETIIYNSMDLTLCRQKTPGFINPECASCN